MIINRPNNIVQKQIAYQSSTVPIYLRMPRSKVYFGTYMAVFSVGTAFTFAGLYTIVKGKGGE